MNSSISTPIVLRGRRFTAASLRVIKSCVDQYYEFGRTRISKEICIRLRWRQPNGWLKDRACRDVLLQLDSLGIIQLPAPKIKKDPQKKKPTATKIDFGKYVVDQTVSEMPQDINFVLAKTNKEEKIWNHLVQQYHYLGHKVIVGRCLKYLVTSGNVVLAAIAYSSPAWHLGTRNQILEKIGFNASDIMNKVVNNSRFLILPTTKVKNLASRILSLSFTQIVTDWTWYYSVIPLVAETFVQPSKYVGTSYRAANWIEIGITKGYAKRGMSYHNSQEPKKVYLIGLNNLTRSKLMKAMDAESERDNVAN